MSVSFGHLRHLPTANMSTFASKRLDFILFIFKGTLFVSVHGHIATGPMTLPVYFEERPPGHLPCQILPLAPTIFYIPVPKFRIRQFYKPVPNDLHKDRIWKTILFFLRPFSPINITQRDSTNAILSVVSRTKPFSVPWLWKLFYRSACICFIGVIPYVEAVRGVLGHIRRRRDAPIQTGIWRYDCVMHEERTSSVWER